MRSGFLDQCRVSFRGVPQMIIHSDEAAVSHLHAGCRQPEVSGHRSASVATSNSSPTTCEPSSKITTTPP